MNSGICSASAKSPHGGMRHAHSLLLPLANSRSLRTSGSSRHKDQNCAIENFNHIPSTSRKALAASASLHYESVRRLLTAETSGLNRDTEMRHGNAAPPRELLASRGAQFRVTSIDKFNIDHNSDECQQCLEYRQQIKKLKRRLSSVRYTDDQRSEQGVEELRAEREELWKECAGLKATIGDLQKQLEEDGFRKGKESESLKEELDEARQTLAEKEGYHAEMQQILLNREDAIEHGRKEYQRLQDVMIHLRELLKNSEATVADQTAALRDAHNKLLLEPANSISEKEKIHYTRINQLTEKLIETETLNCEAENARELEAKQRLTEFNQLQCILDALERSVSFSQEVLQAILHATRLENMEKRATIKKLEEELSDARYRIECSRAERDSSLQALSCENRKLCESLARTQDQVDALSQQVAAQEAHTRELLLTEEHSKNEILAQAARNRSE